MRGNPAPRDDNGRYDPMSEGYDIALAPIEERKQDWQDRKIAANWDVLEDWHVPQQSARFSRAREVARLGGSTESDSFSRVREVDKS